MIPLFQKLYDQDILVNALMDRSIGHIPLLRSREIPLMTDLSPRHLMLHLRLH